MRPWNGSPGTRIEVRHLFYNVPVRRKFLKSPATEMGHICETVTRIALANPRLHVMLRHNGKIVHEIPASAGLLDRIAHSSGNEVRDELYAIDRRPGLLRLTGYIADPKCDRGTAKLQYLFVNGRWIRDRSLAHALQEAYRGLLMTGRYAVGFLFLTVPPDQVDVNVHPTKAEVRFRENSLIYSLVRATVKERLLRENLVPHVTAPLGREPIAVGSSPADFWLTRPAPVQERLPFPMVSTPVADAPGSPGVSIPVADAPGSPNSDAPDAPRPPVADAPGSAHQYAPDTAIQLHDSYLVWKPATGCWSSISTPCTSGFCSSSSRRRVRDGKLEVQRLLIPEPVELPAEQAALVLGSGGCLEGTGSGRDGLRRQHRAAHQLSRSSARRSPQARSSRA